MSSTSRGARTSKQGVPCTCCAAQLPAGLVDAGEDAAQAAARELREETGGNPLASCPFRSPPSMLLALPALLWAAGTVPHQAPSKFLPTVTPTMAVPRRLCGARGGGGPALLQRPRHDQRQHAGAAGPHLWCSLQQLESQCTPSSWDGPLSSACLPRQPACSVEVHAEWKRSAAAQSPCCTAWLAAHSERGIPLANLAQIAFVEVDGDAPENQSIQPHLDVSDTPRNRPVPRLPGSAGVLAVHAAWSLMAAWRAWTSLYGSSTAVVLPP